MSKEFEFPILKIKSKSTLFIFDFENIVTTQNLSAPKKGEGKTDKIFVSQNFKDYVNSINQVGIPIALFIQGSAGTQKQIIDKVLRKVRLGFIDVQYSSEGAAENEEVYRQFKKERLERLIKDYAMIYFFDSDTTFITQLETTLEHRDQFELFKVE